MNETESQQQAIESLLASYRNGEWDAMELGQRILHAAIASSGNVTPDTDRARRTGFPEVVYGAGKTPESILAVLDSLLKNHPEILVTRISPEQARVVSDTFPFTRWNHVARTLRVGREDMPLAPEHISSDPLIGVVTAGTTDEPVALEARETLAWMGYRTLLIQDVGVAGPYRLLARVPDMKQCIAIVCVAGMEATLPTALGGHVSCPVIAVPTSVGYGASMGGIAALLSMLNSCAANVTVVNIDAGFKAGYIAGLIARTAARGDDH
jgi:NCAIR mutase (PurE)-related protein